MFCMCFMFVFHHHHNHHHHRPHITIQHLLRSMAMNILAGSGHARDRCVFFVLFLLLLYVSFVTRNNWSHKHQNRKQNSSFWCFMAHLVCVRLLKLLQTSIYLDGDCHGLPHWFIIHLYNGHIGQYVC